MLFKERNEARPLGMSALKPAEHGCVFEWAMTNFNFVLELALRAPDCIAVVKHFHCYPREKQIAARRIRLIHWL